MSNDISLLRQAFVSQRQFFDDQNFPRGFGRSGNFTLLEVSLMSTRIRRVLRMMTAPTLMSLSLRLLGLMRAKGVCFR